MNSLVATAAIAKRVVEQQCLVRRAMESCQRALANCQSEDTEVGVLPLRGWTRERISSRFKRHALVFAHEFQSEPYIETVLALTIADAAGFQSGNDEVIGSYRLITSLEGEDMDDYLIIDRIRIE